MGGLTGINKKYYDLQNSFEDAVSENKVLNDEIEELKEEIAELKGVQK